jgi:hypothetical protein
MPWTVDAGWRARSVPTMERTTWKNSITADGFEESSVDEIDHVVGADQRLREAFTRNRVDTRIGRRRQRSWPAAQQHDGSSIR